MKKNASFGEHNFKRLCNQLAAKDKDLRNIIHQYGYPPLWSRKPVFETLIHIILEQQVSLASAKAALHKLKEKIGTVTPAKLMALSDAELKACYFSRQKIIYARALAKEIIDRKLSIKQLEQLTDEAAREKLTAIKGIGNWTVDVFLMMVLHHTDLFPTGDIALINSIKHIKQLPLHTTKEDVLLIAASWQPYRTIAAYLLWHAYIKRKNIRF